MPSNLYFWLEVNIAILYQKQTESIFIEHLNRSRIERLVNIQYPLELGGIFSVMKSRKKNKQQLEHISVYVVCVVMCPAIYIYMHIAYAMSVISVVWLTIEIIVIKYIGVYRQKIKTVANRKQQ